jgi:hypothetical protein
MSYLIKNRDVVLSIRNVNTPTKIESQYAFNVKSIKYDLKAKGSEFNGINTSDTLQWYSSLMDFTLVGDSYISPFAIITPITEDGNIKRLYELYVSKFWEGPTFDLGKYRFFLKINNCPIGPDLFEGVITKFSFDESDERLGLFNYDIDFTGKDARQNSAKSGLQGFTDDLILKPLGF